MTFKRKQFKKVYIFVLYARIRKKRTKQLFYSIVEVKSIDGSGVEVVGNQLNDIVFTSWVFERLTDFLDFQKYISS